MTTCFGSFKIFNCPCTEHLCWVCVGVYVGFRIQFCEQGRSAGVERRNFSHFLFVTINSFFIQFPSNISDYEVAIYRIRRCCDIAIQSCFRIYPNKMFILLVSELVVVSLFSSLPVLLRVCVCIQHSRHTPANRTEFFLVIIVIAFIIFSFRVRVHAYVYCITNAEKWRNWNAVLSC